MAHSHTDKFSLAHKQYGFVPNVFQELSLPCAIPKVKEVNQPFSLFGSSVVWWYFQESLKAGCHALEYHNP